MQGGGFGRKGLAPGEVSPRPGVIPAQRSELELQRKREAFLAEERALRSSAVNAFGPVRQQRSLGLAYLLWFLIGQVSAHRFYLGGPSVALPQLGLFIGSLLLMVTGFPGAALGLILFVVWCGWLLVDLFLMPGLHRKHCIQGTRYEEAHEVFS